MGPFREGIKQSVFINFNAKLLVDGPWSSVL